MERVNRAGKRKGSDQTLVARAKISPYSNLLLPRYLPRYLPWYECIRTSQTFNVGLSLTKALRLSLFGNSAHFLGLVVVAVETREQEQVADFTPTIAT